MSVCICQVGHCDDACEVCTDLNPAEPCPYDDGFAADAQAIASDWESVGQEIGRVIGWRKGGIPGRGQL